MLVTLIFASNVTSKAAFLKVSAITMYARYMSLRSISSADLDSSYVSPIPHIHEIPCAMLVEIKQLARGFFRPFSFVGLYISTTSLVY